MTKSEMTRQPIGPGHSAVLSEHDRPRERGVGTSCRDWQAMQTMQAALTTLATLLRSAGMRLTSAQCEEMREACATVVPLLERWIDRWSPDGALASRCASSRTLHVIEAYRTWRETQVLVANVSGQCGRLARDPTGSYWHLYDQVGQLLKQARRLDTTLRHEQQKPARLPHTERKDR